LPRAPSAHGPWSVRENRDSIRRSCRALLREGGDFVRSSTGLAPGRSVYGGNLSLYLTRVALMILKSCEQWRSGVLAVGISSAGRISASCRPQLRKFIVAKSFGGGKTLESR
jgi:hypothetical protein